MRKLVTVCACWWLRTFKSESRDEREHTQTVLNSLSDRVDIRRLSASPVGIKATCGHRSTTRDQSRNHVRLATVSVGAVRVCSAHALILLLLSACATSGGGPTPNQPTDPQIVTLTLVVMNRDARLPGATVQVDDKAPELSNGAGWYGTAVTKGTHRLRVTKDGFQPIDMPVEVPRHKRVVIGLQSLAPPARFGLVHAFGHAVTDDQNTFNALGATMFWGAWGYKVDRAKFDQNLDALPVDYVRYLGQVAWDDRRVSNLSVDEIQAITDATYARGKRVQWTIFGDVKDTQDAASRRAYVQRFADALRGREEKVFAFEIANEGYQNGFPDGAGTTELRELGRFLQSKTTNLVALSAPRDGSQVCATYAGSGAPAATMHYERSFRADDAQGFHFGPIRQPWGYPDEYDALCNGQLPKLVFNNEPIGPESSVNADDQPLDLVLAYAMTFVAQNAAYVLHTGPGVQGGGAGDVARGRNANFYDLPRWTETVAALKAAKAALPPGLANWTKQNAQWSGFPIAGYDHLVTLDTIVRAYAAIAGQDFWVIVLGAKGPVTGTAKRAMAIDALDPLTWQPTQHFDLAAGQAFTLSGAPAFVLRGTFK